LKDTKQENVTSYSKSENTGQMPWDKIWDFKHYRVSKVRKIITRVRILSRKVI
jgi:hypothetical protein